MTAESMSEPARLQDYAPPSDPPFRVRKIGHVVLRAADLARSVAFYTSELLAKV